MGSGSLLSVIARRWYIVLTVMIAAGVGAWLVAERLDPRFTATTTLRVQPAPGAEVPYRLDYADRFANSLATLAESPWMSRILVERVGVPDTTKVVAELPANTDLVTLSVTLPNPSLAARAANEAGSVLVDLSTQAEPAVGSTAAFEPSGTLVLQQFDEALPPLTESGPVLPVIIGAALLLGLLLGSALAAATTRDRATAYVAAPAPQSSRT